MGCSSLLLLLSFLHKTPFSDTWRKYHSVSTKGADGKEVIFLVKNPSSVTRQANSPLVSISSSTTHSARKAYLPAPSSTVTKLVASGPRCRVCPERHEGRPLQSLRPFRCIVIRCPRDNPCTRMTIMRSTGFWRNEHGGFCQQMKRRSAGRAAPDRCNGRREGATLLRRVNTVKNRCSKN